MTKKKDAEAAAPVEAEPAPPADTGKAEPGTAVAPPPSYMEKMMAVIMEGDISQMTPIEKAQFCYQLAVSCGLNPLTKPFDILKLGGRTVIYANRTCADQIRKRDNLKSRVTYSGPMMMKPNEFREDVYMVMVELEAPDGRTETGIGCINIHQHSGEALANAVMKCHTKALRRATMSMGGLGFLDEVELPDTSFRGSPNAPEDYRPIAPKLAEPPTIAPIQPVQIEAVAVDMPQPSPSPVVAEVVQPVAVQPEAPVPPPKATGPRPLPRVVPPTRQS